MDRWLWSVRQFPTRTAATEACRGGHVVVNGTSAKPSAVVQAGDRVVLRLAGRRRELEVVEAVDRRVGAAAAAACLVDHSPPADRSGPAAPARERSAGRPTKRDRRAIDRLRGR